MSEYMYKQQIIDRYQHPKYKRVLENIDVQCDELNPLCGDRVCMQLTVGNEMVTEAAWQGEGCAISLVAADLLAEKLTGMKINEVHTLQVQDMVALLGIDIKPSRIKCAALAMHCVQHALPK